MDKPGTSTYEVSRAKVTSNYLDGAGVAALQLGRVLGPLLAQGRPYPGSCKPVSVQEEFGCRHYA